MEKNPMKYFVWLISEMKEHSKLLLIDSKRCYPEQSGKTGTFKQNRRK